VKVRPQFRERVYRYFQNCPTDASASYKFRGAGRDALMHLGLLGVRTETILIYRSGSSRTSKQYTNMTVRWLI
jgi:hypothetical protein